MAELRLKILFIISQKKCVLVCFLLLSNIIWRSKWHILNHLCFRSVRKAFWWEKNVSIYVEQQYNTMQYKSPLDCRKWLASHSQNKGGKLQNNSMEDQSVTSRLCNSTFAGSTLSLNSHLSKERRTSTVIFHWLFTLQDKFSCQFLVSQ